MLKLRFIALAWLLAQNARALDGDFDVHDPSTVIYSDGRYYTYGTGKGLPVLSSDDGWRWHKAGNVMDAVPGGNPGPQVLAKGGNNTWAPDVIHVGDKYFLYYSAPGVQPKSAIGLLIGSTLNPDAPNYGWQDGGPVVWSDGEEDSNAIDPGVFVDHSDNTLWLSYGSYFGYIRLVQLNPATGQRLHPDLNPFEIAINSEASIIIAHDDWYYLLVTHGSCCVGSNSSYNIRMGRSHNVKGPYLDNMGIDMLQGGGKLLLGSGGRHIGPGHFGLIELEDGVQKFSLHYEADLDRGGRSVLDILPLWWRDGWPVAGEHIAAGRWQIESLRTGTALELAVEGVPVGGPRRPERSFTGVIEDQQVSQVSTAWPNTAITVRMAPYLLQAQQQWSLTPITVAGYPGEPYFRISISGSERTLAATTDNELVVEPAFTADANQLWRIDQLADGSYRIQPKSSVDAGTALALSAIGSSTPTLMRFDAASDRQHWLLKKP